MSFSTLVVLGFFILLRGRTLFSSVFYTKGETEASGQPIAVIADLFELYCNILNVYSDSFLFFIACCLFFFLFFSRGRTLFSSGYPDQR